MSELSSWYQEQAAFWHDQNHRRTPEHPAVAAFAIPKLEFILNTIQRTLPGAVPNDWRILDVGCGNGYFTHYLSKWAPTVGVDFAPTMLGQNPSPHLTCASVTSLPFESGSFDLVVCSNLLHHVDAPRDAVREMARVSRGFVALSEPNCMHLAMAMFCAALAEERGALKFNLNYLRRLLGEAGLRELGVATQGSIVPNKCPVRLAHLLKPFDRVPLFRMYCVAVGMCRQPKGVL